MNLTHLKQLEAESMHIIREVAAEFDNPVMLYSILLDIALHPGDGVSIKEGQKK